MRKPILFYFLVFVVCLLFGNKGWASSIVFQNEEYTAYSVRGTLAGSPDYNWWYGCSPTSAGMMIGYYDINGYDGKLYDNLVPGGAAESSNYGNSGAAVNNIIASQGHIEDFWTGYGHSGDDPLASVRTGFDSLADFMGTSQDNLIGVAGPISNVDGGTMFWYYTNGAKTNVEDLANAGYGNYDGAVGIGEYLTYGGYSWEQGSLYNQYTDNISSAYGLPYGFTFADYKNEIDNSRPVLIQVEGHTMLGYGYVDDGSQTINVYDTWTPVSSPLTPHTMTWGGGYPYGQDALYMYGVTCLEISGGDQHAPVPEPSTVCFMLLGICGLFGFGVKKIQS